MIRLLALADSAEGPQGSGSCEFPPTRVRRSRQRKLQSEGSNAGLIDWWLSLISSGAQRASHCAVYVCTRRATREAEGSGRLQVLANCRCLLPSPPSPAAELRQVSRPTSISPSLAIVLHTHTHTHQKNINFNRMFAERKYPIYSAGVTRKDGKYLMKLSLP